MFCKWELGFTTFSCLKQSYTFDIFKLEIVSVRKQWCIDEKDEQLTHLEGIYKNIVW